MIKAILASSVLAIVAAAYAGAPPSAPSMPAPSRPADPGPVAPKPPAPGPITPADGSAPCFRTTFKTELIKNACTSGGQKAAKDAMKQFQKDHHIKSCDDCHTKLAPHYDLKGDGLDQFLKYGGH